MDSANVESIDTLKAFRVALWKFVEGANSALAETEGEISRAMVWLETEQNTFWDGQIRKRTELVTRAKEALRAKKLFQTDISKRSTIDEEKALALAQRRLEEANDKLGAVRRYARKLQKEALNYRGQVQRLAGMLQVEIPGAVDQLDRLVARLEEYVGMAPPAQAESSPTETLPGMARAAEPVPEETATQDQPGDLPDVPTPREPGKLE